MRLTYKVKLDMPNLLKGEAVYVDGIGVLKNGSSEHVELESSFADVLRNSYGFIVEKSSGKPTIATEARGLEEQPVVAVTTEEEGGET